MKIKPWHGQMVGIISLENNPFINEGEWNGTENRVIKGDFGIQIAQDGRVWICIDGIAFVRFTPTNKYKAVGHKLQPGKE